MSGIGVSGLVTVVPALEPVGAIFGLGLIVWFVWFVWFGVVTLGDLDARPAVDTS